MQFSVLLSVYNQEKPEYLQQAMDSVLKQTVKANEIVIVKDGALTEALDRILDRYKTRYPDLIKIVSFRQNRGLGLALRDGTLACTYEYIARMDTDDICESTRFEKQMQYLSQHPELAVLGSQSSEFCHDPHKADSYSQMPCSNQEIVRFAKFRNPFRHSSVVFRKEAVLASGNYRDFLWFEDYDLWVRVLQKGYRVANMPDCLMKIRCDRTMFARRGGWQYLKQDMRFLRLLHTSGFINSWQWIVNMTIRGFIRIVPNDIRAIFYKNLLRKSAKHS